MKLSLNYKIIFTIWALILNFHVNQLKLSAIFTVNNLIKRFSETVALLLEKVVNVIN